MSIHEAIADAADQIAVYCVICSGDSDVLWIGISD
jgi:hypothetical protein